jgi:hypothetical protein
VETVRIIDFIAECYADFLPQFFSNSIPVESAATCSNCAMLEKNDSLPHAPMFFSAGTKCCTHHPELPNYMVGALISTTDPGHVTGRERMMKKIADRTSVTPLGLFRPKKYTLLLKNANPEYFGNSEILRCPFYETAGNCSLRPYWDAVCSTWFCKYNSGKEGRLFWGSLRKYMENLEKILSRYVLLKMGFDFPKPGISIAETTPLTLQELDDLPPLAHIYNELWGAWTGRETEFYKEAYKIITQLRQEEFDAIEGVEQKIIQRELEQAYDQMMNSHLPERLKRNPELIVEKMSDAAYLLSGYSPLDPLKAGKRTYDCLDLFDGIKTNQEALKVCLEKYKFRLTEENLLKLHQFRILIAVGG